MAYELKTFSDIIEAVREELGIQTSDTVTYNRIRRSINMAYINEIVPYKSVRWKWLSGHTQLTHKAKYTGGTASVTPESTTVTLSTAPGASLGSFKNYKFAVLGFDEVYTIDVHTAESTSITLKEQFNGNLNATASFVIWRDSFDLPTDCRETVDVWHNRYSDTMKGIGRQELRRLQTNAPLLEDFATHYTTVEFYDPTPLDVMTEADRYRQVIIHPAISGSNYTIYVDYIKEVEALDADTDEPLIPLEDRVVLVYGALKRMWQYYKDPESVQLNATLFRDKLDQMAGRKEDSFDTPLIQPKSRYLRAQRASRLGALSRAPINRGGGTSQNDIKYAKDITLEGGTITSNFTVSSGVTIDGRDISADGIVLDSLSSIYDNLTAGERVLISNASLEVDESVITSAELTFLDDVTALTTATLTDNTTNETVLTVASTSFTALEVKYSLNRSATREMGTLTIISDGTSPIVVRDSAASIGSNGVTFSVVDNGTTLTLRSTTTSTGSNATMKYKVHKWLA